MLKIVAYFIYFTIFTYCYYVLNRKLANKWIFILYPAIFCASIYPIKIWFDYIRPRYGDAFAGTWLKIILMMFASLCLFNVGYEIVNFTVNKQVRFQQNYGQPNVGFVKSFVDNASNIKAMAHFFFYVGGVVLMYIAVTKY
ncbi:hypothetical protein DYU05_18600 [Mucilaginibacter terrenus]|uniref:Uncharacterized protein n=1 Tax=Mucilaginibacter terrenus TaxID=2482727 RepID=A0A3E2NLI7_9SPHI|nr:hypothetical protein [Mucilaginibacter terrenus]RFZ81831.1 hypothetical protein DYU05_18600 [Mucilaginibacter terrenus]